MSASSEEVIVKSQTGESHPFQTKTFHHSYHDKTISGPPDGQAYGGGPTGGAHDEHDHGVSARFESLEYQPMENTVSVAESRTEGFQVKRSP